MKRRFAQVSHEYLIEQLQKQSASASTSFKLNFNHPVKELIWTEASITQTYDTAQLKLNGHDSFSAQEEEYFQLRQSISHLCHTPKLPGSTSSGGTRLFVNLFTGTNLDQADATVAQGGLLAMVYLK